MANVEIKVPREQTRPRSISLLHPHLALAIPHSVSRTISIPIRTRTRNQNQKSNKTPTCTCPHLPPHPANEPELATSLFLHRRASPALRLSGSEPDPLLPSRSRPSRRHWVTRALLVALHGTDAHRRRRRRHWAAVPSASHRKMATRSILARPLLDQRRRMRTTMNSSPYDRDRADLLSIRLELN